MRVPAIEVECKPRFAKFPNAQVARSKQAYLLLYRPQKSKWRMRQLQPENGKHRRQQYGSARSVVRPKPGVLVGTEHVFAFSHRARTYTDWHSVYVSGQHSP